jgi:enoyl reductase-like protein
LRNFEGNMAQSLCDQIFTKPIFWDKVTAFNPMASNLVDFGPGGLNGVGSLTQRNLDGTGVALCHFGGSDMLYSQTFESFASWENTWGPKLERDSYFIVNFRDGRVLINNALTRLTGKPPIWCCGMTPSTVSGEFVVAITNSGYSVELAGGGHYNAKMLREKIEFIKNNIEPGHGIILNSLYINQRQWGFQYPLWCQLRKEGVPVEGLTIAAGIPSGDVAKEIIKNLKEAGIKFVSFKPGSTEGLLQVAAIARTNPDFPIILQWTGGRAGGHHSYEDMHEPLIATYSQLRRNPNLVLVVGSGLGSAEDSWPYITGDWSLKFGLPKMPTDGVLFGSRLMTAKECKTSLAAKEAIVAASGVEDKLWEGTYRGETGGIITVQSELGEPIHKIATRGVKLWKELDDNLFCLPKPKRLEWLQKNKDYVINRLNKDFQKPWFPKSKTTSLVLNCVEEMSYEDVVYRMTELMYVSHQSRWIHISQQNLVGQFLLRTEERFIKEGAQFSNHTAFLSSDPFKYLDQYFEKYPKAKIQPLSSEDVEYFLTLCTTPGSKPVPFINLLDENFEIGFKKVFC